MKKIYSLFILCFSLSVSAQLTEANHAPSPGNNFELYDCDATGIDPGPSGAGVTWTFTGTNTTVTPLAYQTLTVNNPTYPNAKVAVAASATNSSYYLSDPTGLWFYGGFIPIPQISAEFIYTQPAVKAKYPMSLNSTSTTAIAGSVNVTSPAIAGTFTGTSETLCDGTGTLSVAGSTTANVYRVVTTQTLDITTSLANGTLVQKNYDYYEPDTKAPLFSISTSTLVLLAQTNTLTSVSRLKVYHGTGINELTNAAPLEIYPNPAVNELKVLSSENDYSLVIFDMTGKQIGAVSLHKGVNRVDVSSFAKGLYVYKIEDKEGVVKNTGKLTLIQ